MSEYFEGQFELAARLAHEAALTAANAAATYDGDLERRWDAIVDAINAARGADGSTDEPKALTHIRALLDPTPAGRCQCWNEGQYGRVHREDCPLHRNDADGDDGADGKIELEFNWSGGPYIDVRRPPGTANEVINVWDSEAGRPRIDFTRADLIDAVNEWVEGYGEAALIHDVRNNWTA